MNKLSKALVSSNKRAINLKKISKDNIFEANRNKKYILIKSKNKQKFPWIKFMIAGGFLFSFAVYVNKTFETSSKIQKSISKSTREYIHSTLASNELKEGGVDLLEGLLNSKITFEGLINLIQNLLKDPRVLNETKNFGSDIIMDIVQDQEITKKIKEIIVDIIKAPELKEEAINILRFIVDQDESKDIIAQYFKVIFLRDDIVKSLASLLTEAVTFSLNSAVTKKKFTEFATDIWSDPNLRWFILKRSVNFWSPSNVSKDKPSATENNIDDKNKKVAQI